jgi:hypothetical protein
LMGGSRKENKICCTSSGKGVRDTLDGQRSTQTVHDTTIANLVRAMQRFRDALGKAPRGSHTAAKKKPGGFTPPGFVVYRLTS